MKRLSACTMCDKDLWESISRWHEGHPLAGQVQIRGKVKAEAVRVTMALLDGSTTDITFCAECAHIVHEHLPMLWNKISERHVMSIDKEFRSAVGYPEHTPDQQRKAVEEAIQFVHNRPLGVVAIQKWSEVMI